MYFFFSAKIGFQLVQLAPRLLRLRHGATFSTTLARRLSIPLDQRGAFQVPQHLAHDSPEVENPGVRYGPRDNILTLFVDMRSLDIQL